MLKENERRNERMSSLTNSSGSLSSSDSGLATTNSQPQRKLGGRITASRSLLPAGLLVLAFCSGGFAPDDLASQIEAALDRARIFGYVYRIDPIADVTRDGCDPAYFAGLTELAKSQYLLSMFGSPPMLHYFAKTTCES